MADVVRRHQTIRPESIPSAEAFGAVALTVAAGSISGGGATLTVERGGITPGQVTEATAYLNAAWEVSERVLDHLGIDTADLGLVVVLLSAGLLLFTRGLQRRRSER